MRVRYGVDESKNKILRFTGPAAVDPSRRRLNCVTFCFLPDEGVGRDRSERNADGERTYNTRAPRLVRR